MFIDSIEIKLISDKGGDIIFKVDKNSHTLANFRGRKILKAQ
jgi:GTPase involved in cell partitioning and DNA repair